MRLIIKSCFIIFFVSFLSANANTLYDSNSKKIIYCNENVCKQYDIPSSLKEWFLSEHESSNFEIEKFHDGKYYFLLSADNNGVNICYDLILPIEFDKIQDSATSINLIPREDKRLVISPDNKELCNFRVLPKGLLSSSYRSGARWYDEIYQYKNGKYILKNFDEHFGDFIKRSIYEGDDIKKELVSEYESITDYDKRVPLFGEVTRKKLYLFDQPKSDSQSKKYLIKSDKVKLIDYHSASSEGETDWLQVEYFNPKKGKISGWVYYDGILIVDEKELYKN